MNSPDRCRGVTLTWVLITMVVFIGVLALVIDIGYLVLVGQQLQNGADAAALAGALFVRSDLNSARQLARDIGLANSAARAPIQLRLNETNDPDGDIVLGRYQRETRTFTPRVDAPNAVKVVARRTNTSLGGPLSLLFGPAIGFATSEIERMAIAMTGGGTGKGMVILAEPDEECALYIYGNTDVYVNGGVVHVNSDHECAACYQGSIIMDAVSIDAVGDHCITGGGADINTELRSGQERIDDPLKDLPPPPYDPANDLGSISVTGGENVVISPGYYSGGIEINNGTLTLEPGIYILDGVDGKGLNILGNANFYAEGVMFYVIGTGEVHIGGTGEVIITPPDPDDYDYPGVITYEGLSIFQARDNYSEGTIIGTSLLRIDGTLYFPKNHMGVGGTATKLGSQFIVWSAEFFGNGEIIVAFEGNVAAPGGGVYIVE